MSRYATPPDLAALSLPAAFLAQFSSDQQQSALDSASGSADEVLVTRYTLPLAAPFPGGLVQAVCDIAAYRLMKSIGFNPDGGDKVIVMGFKNAQDWLTDVAENRRHPQVVDSSAPASSGGPPPRVFSSPKRGW